MEQLGYVYNRRAAEMRSLSSRIVGLVVTNVRNPYFAELTMAVEEAAGAEGYTVLLGCSTDDVDRQRQILQAMVEHRVDGVILLPASQSTPPDLGELLDRAELPHVLVARGVYDYASDYVGADNVASGRLIGRHLLEIGARSVAFVGGVTHSIPRDDRRRGLLEGLEPEVPTLVADLPSAHDATEGLSAMLGEMLSTTRPDALVAYNDMYAFWLLGALRAHGVEPGRDVAVASFDDVPEAARTFPTLTSAAGFPARVGRIATELLLGAVAEESEGQSQHMLVDPVLQARESTLEWAARRRSVA
jgi:LacI family transcriptional regulator